VGGGGGGGESPLRKTAIKSAHRAPVGTHFRRLKTVAAADRLAVEQQGLETSAAGGINIHFKQSPKFKCLAASVFKYTHTHKPTYYLRRIYITLLCIFKYRYYVLLYTISYYTFSRMMADIFFHPSFPPSRGLICLFTYINDLYHNIIVRGLQCVRVYTAIVVVAISLLQPRAHFVFIFLNAPR